MNYKNLPGETWNEVMISPNHYVSNYGRLKTKMDGHNVLIDGKNMLYNFKGTTIKLSTYKLYITTNFDLSVCLGTSFQHITDVNGKIIGFVVLDTTHSILYDINYLLTKDRYIKSVLSSDEVVDFTTVRARLLYKNNRFVFVTEPNNEELFNEADMDMKQDCLDHYVSKGVIQIGNFLDIQIYNKNSTIDFGKHDGKSISTIIKEDPEYVSWVNRKISDVIIKLD